MLRLSEWILKHRSASIAIVAGLIVVGFTIYNPGWWGDRALGVIIGAVTFMVLFSSLMFLLEKTKTDFDSVAPWLLFLIPTGTALVVRRLAGNHLVWPIQFHTPATPSPQSLLIIFIAVFMLLLSIAMVRALSRGEGVSIESNWGGLGGGLGGFRLSSPLIYLLGMFFLLLMSGAIAWKVFAPPPAAASQQATQPAQTPTPSPSP